MSRPCLVATSLILAACPTRIALMIPASADSIAPRNELSSHGCATTIVTPGTALAAAIRRSYFDPGCFAGASAGLVLIVSLREVCRRTNDAIGPAGPHRRSAYSLMGAGI